jgi:hypothetical protein
MNKERCAQATRYCRIANVQEIDAQRLDNVIQGYANGDGSLSAALNALMPGEIKALKAFNKSLINGTHPELKELADAAENACKCSGSYNPRCSPRERIMQLLSDILRSLP